MFWIYLYRLREIDFFGKKNLFIGLNGDLVWRLIILMLDLLFFLIKSINMIYWFIV